MRMNKRIFIKYVMIFYLKRFIFRLFKFFGNEEWYKKYKKILKLN